MEMLTNLNDRQVLCEAVLSVLLVVVVLYFLLTKLALGEHALPPGINALPRAKHPT